jgi:hypothetical protein
VISLRYHIVSIVAVFLALGLGIVLGSSVVSSPLQSRLNADVERYKDERDRANEEADVLERDNDALRSRVVEQIAPWATTLRLDGLPFVIVSDAPKAPEWRDHVSDALVAAGAELQGTILLSDRWNLTGPDDEADLEATMRSIVPTFEPDDDVVSAAMSTLGERFTEPTGRALVDVLERDGFMTVQGRTEGDWPPPGASVVMLSAARPGEPVEQEPQPLPYAAALARSIAAVTPTLVVTNMADEPSVVATLRDADGLPDGLATFDAGTEESDPGGIGVVAALLAATEDRGGHYGTARGLTFVAPAPPPD